MSEEETSLFVAVTADEDDWLPYILMGMPLTEEEPISKTNSILVALTPEEALEAGATLIQAARTVSDLTASLSEKSVEERKEIISLEAMLVDDDAL